MLGLFQSIEGTDHSEVVVYLVGHAVNVLEVGPDLMLQL